jgi:hypothetical protein
METEIPGNDPESLDSGTAIFQVEELGIHARRVDKYSGDFRPIKIPSRIVDHIASEFLPGAQPLAEWQVRRCSNAVVIIRETRTGRSLVTKVYAEKTGSSP